MRNRGRRSKLWVLIAVGLAAMAFSGCTLVSSNTVAVIHLSHMRGTVPLTILYDGTGSSSPEGISTYRWTFGDGREAYGVTGEHTFQRAGTYTVELMVRGEDGAMATQLVEVEVGPAFWVADENLSEIYKLDASGTVILTLASPVSRPRGLALAFQGNTWRLFVVCEGDGFPRTVVLNPSTGEEIARWTAPAQDPGGLTYSPVTPIRLWHVDKLARKIFEINPPDGMNLNAFGATYFQSSPHLGEAPFLQTPGGIAWKSGARDAGSLWVLEAETRLLYELEIVAAVNIFDGTQLALQPDPIPLSAELFPITGLDWHGDSLWVVDRSRHRVAEVDPETGLPTGVFLSGFPGAAVSGLYIQE
jgi:hypothetical protein